MNRFISLIVLSITSLFLSACCNSTNRSNTRQINAADYGLSDTVKDATPYILKAIEACKAQGATKLILPKGRYEFYPDKAYEQYCAISNNSNGKKRIAFPLLNIKDLEIDGQGASLIFHGQMIPFVIENSKNISIRNLSIDWDKPLYGQATVIAVDSINKTFDIEIHQENDYEIIGSELIFKSEGFEGDIQKNLFFDPETKATVYHVNQHKLDPWNKKVRTRYAAKEIAPRKVRITDSIAALPKVGWLWVAKGGINKTRQSPAFRVFNSFNLLFEHVSIHHAGAMGLIAERSGDITLEKFNVQLPPNSKRVVSTTADATHFVNCKGLIKFNNCIFENMLDDATNVHGIYTKLVKVIDQKTIGVQTIHHEQHGFTFATKGDTLRLINPETMICYKGDLIVDTARMLNEEYTEITFTQAINDIAQLGSSVENQTWNASMSMNNCTVRQNRARSILISTPRKALVENCTFSSMMAGIAIHSDANFWFESGQVNDVIIRNNTFIDLCTGGKGNAVIRIHPTIPDISKMTEAFHRNITIEGNTIKTFDRAIVDALSVDNLIIINNKIEQSNSFEPIFPDKPSFLFTACQNVKLTGNSYTGENPANVRFEGDSAKHLTMKNNKGFE